MKNYLNRACLIGALIACVITSCSKLSEKLDSEEAGSSDEGMLTLSLVNVSMESRAVGTSDFIVKILKNNQEVASYSKYSLMPEIVNLPIGSYRVVAYSSELQDAAFDAPYYYGYEDFTIEKKKLTTVNTLICYFSNIKVMVGYTDDLYELLGNDVKVNVAIGNGSLDYPMSDTTKMGFFKSVDDENILIATLTGTVDGQSVTAVQNYTDVKAGDFRHLRFSLKKIEEDDDTETGVVIIGDEGFVIDASCDKVDLGEVSVDVPEDEIQDTPEKSPEDGGGEDPGPGDDANAPTIVGDGFDIDQAVSASRSSVRILIDAESNVKDINVEIESPTLTPSELAAVGLASEFSLAEPGSLEGGLAGLGFPVGDQVYNQPSVVFDISQFMPLLQLLGAATHEFHISVEDMEGLTTIKTLTIITE